MKSSPSGKTIIVAGDSDLNAIDMKFPLATSSSMTVALDPLKRYNVFVEMASTTDFLSYATEDSGMRVAAGTAKFGSVVTQANVAANGLLGVTPAGATGFKITQVKDAAATDDTGIITALGGYRCVVRFQEIHHTPITGNVFPSVHSPAVAFA